MSKTTKIIIANIFLLVGIITCFCRFGVKSAFIIVMLSFGCAVLNGCITEKKEDNITGRIEKLEEEREKEIKKLIDIGLSREAINDMLKSYKK